MQQSQKIFSLYRPSVGFKLAETQPVAYSLAFERHVSSVFTYGKAGGLEGKRLRNFSPDICIPAASTHST